MNTKNVRTWIKALRSEKYKQGDGCLKRKVGSHVEYCCLGVAAELCGLESKIRLNNVYSFGKESYFLPPEAVKWLGVKSEDPAMGRLKLSVMNDRGESFEDIATEIEDYLAMEIKKKNVKSAKRIRNSAN